MRCPRCDSENTDQKAYCDQCGTLLRNIATYASEMEYNSSSPLEYRRPSQVFSYHQKLTLQPGITVFRVIRSILYFIAAFFAAFGFIGTFTAVFGSSNRSEGLAIFFGLGLLVASVIIFLRIRYRTPCLHWQQFIWSILGATVGMFMALILVFALAPNGELSDLSFGFIVMLYGLVLATIALW